MGGDQCIWDIAQYAVRGCEDVNAVVQLQFEILQELPIWDMLEFDILGFISNMQLWSVSTVYYGRVTSQYSGYLWLFYCRK